MLTDSFDANRSTEKNLSEEIHAEYDRLRRIVQMDGAELNHIVDGLLPELADVLRRTNEDSPRRLEWEIRRLLHEVNFSKAGLPAADDSLRLMRELHVRLFVRAMARAQQAQARRAPTWADVPTTEPMCG